MEYKILYFDCFQITSFLRFGDVLDIFRQKIVQSYDHNFIVDVKRNFLNKNYCIFLIEIKDSTISDDYKSHALWILPLMIDLGKVIEYYRESNCGAKRVTNYLGEHDWNLIRTQWGGLFPLKEAMVNFIANNLKWPKEDVLFVLNVNLTDDIIRQLACEHVHENIFRLRTRDDDYVIGYAINRRILEDTQDGGKLYGSLIYEALYGRYFGFCAESYFTINGRKMETKEGTLDISTENFSFPMYQFFMDLSKLKERYDVAQTTSTDSAQSSLRCLFGGTNADIGREYFLKCISASLIETRSLRNIDPNQEEQSAFGGYFDFETVFRRAHSNFSSLLQGSIPDMNIGIAGSSSGGNLNVSSSSDGNPDASTPSGEQSDTMDIDKPSTDDN